MRHILTAGIVALALAPHAAHAAGMQELSQTELRSIVEAGQSLGLRSILDSIKKTVSGEPVDVRAFESNGVYYHILVMRPNGQLTSVVVNAATGLALSSASANAKAVRQAARANPPGKARSGAKSGNAATGQGNSGSNGPGNSGNGNSGGSGGNGGGGGGNGGGGGGNGGGGNGGGANK